MDESPCGVIRTACFELLLSDAPPALVPCQLSYEVGDPFAVTARFALGDHSVSWTFARSLLRAGMYEPVGEGDMAIRPGIDDSGRSVVYVRLTSPQGEAVLRTSSAEIAAFLEMTQQLVAIGAELSGVDLDALIRELLEQTSA